MVELPGLISSTPIGAMAAMGLLRILAQDLGLAVHLSWQQGRACLDGVTAEEAIEYLIDQMRERANAFEWNWAESPRNIAPKRYRKTCDQAQERGDQRALDFLAGWASDAVLRKESVTPTAFEMTSGNQKLIRDLRSIVEKLSDAEFARQSFKSALLGGPYTEQVSFGWDPMSARSHAHEAQAPTKSTPPGKPGLIWLAAESIPLHPVVPVSSSRVQTTGWDGNWTYVWCAWDAALSLDEVRLVRSIPVDQLDAQRGITEVWRSHKKVFGQYGGLLPGQRER